MHESTVFTILAHAYITVDTCVCNFKILKSPDMIDIFRIAVCGFFDFPHKTCNYGQ